MKAMLLAAGRGIRMKHLTHNKPKPLLSLGDCSLLEYNLKKCRDAGITDVIINVAYHAKHITDLCGSGQAYGLNIAYSHEGDQPLGTAHGVRRALPLLGDAPFLVMASDIVCSATLKHYQLPEHRLLHCMLVPNTDEHPEGDYHLDAQQQLQLQGSPTWNYGGIACLHPDLFKLNTHCASLGTLWAQAIAQGQGSGQLFKGAWFNVGTPERLKQAKAWYQSR
jgi:N-acetyl-alpha-D-muramate 1-phosphate uridylyltransferase